MTRTDWGWILAGAWIGAVMVTYAFHLQGLIV